MVISDLNEGEKSFRRLAENLPGIVYRILIEDDNRVIFFNDMVQTMTGYSPEDLKKGKVCSIDPLIFPEDRLNVINIVKDAIENNVPFEAEYRIHNKGGELKWFFERGRPIRGDNGNPSYIDGVIFDITNRKKAEQKLKESEKNFKTIFDESPIGIELYDSNGKLVDLNESCLDIFGVSSIDDVRGFELFKNPNIPREQLKKLKKGHIIRQETIFDFDLVKDLNLYETKKSGKIWIDLLISPLFLEENNTISNYLIQTQDVTESKIAEQKLIVLNEELDKKIHERTKQLKKSEEQHKILSTELETILDHYPGLAFYKDTNNNFIRVNQNLVDYYNSDTAAVKANLTKRDIEGKNLSTLLPKDIAQAYWDDDLEVIKSGTPKLNLEDSFKTEHGIRLLNSHKIPHFDENGEIRGIIGFSIDITESKKAEQKLKDSEEKFRLLFDSIADPIHVIDADLKIMYMNPAFERWLKSFNLDLNIVGKTPVEAWPFIGERVYDEYQKVFKTKQIHIKEDWAHVNDTDTFTETRKIPILKSGNVVQVITIIRDFSDRKKAELKLEESEKKFKLYYENAPMGYQSLDSNGNILDVNKAWINFFGYSKEEVIGKSFGDFIDSEYLEVYNTRFLKFKETGELAKADFEIIKKDGSHAIVLFNGNINFDENGNFKQTHCIFQDITEQQQIQIELRESENLLKNAQELAHIGHWKLNPSTMEVSGSDELFKIFGLTHDEATLEKFAEVVHPEDREMDLFHIRRGMEKGESWDIEHRVISKDGTEKWVHTLGEAIKDDDGKIIMLIGTVQDITERKEMEQKYLKQNVFLSNILESLTHPFYVINVKDYKVALVNSTASSEGLEKGQYCYTLNHHKNKPCEAPCVCPLNEVKNTKKSCVVEHTHYDKEGNEKIYEIYGYPILDENGNVVQMIEYALNITDRKIAQQALKKSERKYRGFVNNISDIIYEIDIKGGCSYVSHQLFDISGFSTEEIIGQKVFKFVHPDDLFKVAEEVKIAFNSEDNRYIEFRLRHKDGHYVSVSSRFSTITIGEKQKLTGVLVDITERKKADQKLKESEENSRDLARQWQTTFDAMGECVFLLNLERKIIQCNKITLDFLEKKDYGEIIGHSCCEIIHGTKEPVEWCPMVRMIESSHKESYIVQIGDRWCEISIDPVINDEGNLIGAVHIITDITERKKVEQKLIESEEKFRTITEQSLMGIIIIQNGRVIYVNEAESSIMEYSTPEIMEWGQEDLLKHIHPDDIAKAINRSRKKQQGQEIPPSFSYRIVTKSGIPKNVEVNTQDIEFNEKPAILTYVLDVTEKKVAEQKYESLINNLTDIILELDIKGIASYVSPQCYDILGYQPSEIIGKSALLFVHPEDTSVIAESMKKAFGTEETISILPFRLLHKDGDVINASARGKYVNVGGNGKFIVAIRDITFQKRIEQELKLSEEKYRDLFENSPISLWEEDFSGVKNYIEILKNSGIKDFRAYFDKNPEEVKKCASMIKLVDINKKTLELYKANKKEDFFADLEKIFTEVSLDAFKEQIITFARGKTWFESEAINWTLNGEKIHIFIVSEIVTGFKEDWSKILVSITDISDRKKAEQELKESEEKFRTITEQSFMGIIIIQDGLFKYFNHQAADINGYSLEEIQNWKPYEFAKIIHPEDSDFVMEQARKKQKGKIDVVNRHKYRIIKKSGEIAWVDNFSKTINYMGRFADLVMTEDITDKIIVEQQLKESEEKLRKQNVFLNNILESLTHPFYVINVKDYTIALANFTASSEGLELGKSCYSLTHNINKPCEAPCECPLKEVKKTKSTCVVEHIHYDKEGNAKAYEIYGYPILDESGNVVQMIEYALDISDRKKAEQQLIESEEKFRTIAERTLIGIIIIQNNQIKYVNDALLDIFEHSQKEIANWEFDDLTKLIHPEDLPFLKEYREHLRSGEKSFKSYYSYRVLTKSGKMKWIDQISKEISYKEKSADLLTIMDITDKKEAEQELIKISNLKFELLSRTSHELKTPLVSIKGFTDILLELYSEKLDDNVIRTIKQIKMGCNRLESLVHDILKTAELTSGIFKLKISKDDLSTLIKLCVIEFEGMLELRNHTINLEISDNLICSFERDQIYNVITNIISNAIKYTPYSGKIEVKSEIKNDFIIISVKDNGIGFSKEERNLIFKQFGKIEHYGQGYDIITEGSGLGLYISKKIIEMHGGEIWLESEGRDKGSTIYFSLPIV